MAEDTHEKKHEEKKKTNPLVYVGIGCLVLIVLLGIGATIVGKFVASKVAGGMLGKVIENKTGVKTNIADLEKGKMTFTDNKTGATVNVGTGEVPETFPKDFPLYPGAKVTSSLSGGKNSEGNGFWLTLMTPDSFEKVASFYKSAFTGSGWTVEATAMYTENNSTQTVTKGNLSGSLSIVKGDNGEGTQIVIVLGEETK